MKPVISMGEIARRDEARIARVMQEMANEWRPFAGGIMARGLRGAWFNSAHGAGFAGPVEESEVEGLIRFYEEKQIEPRVELSPFAHETLIALLAKHQFVLKRFETISYRALTPTDRIESPYPAPAGMRIVPVDPADTAAVNEYAHTSISGFLPEGVEPTPELLASAKLIVHHPRSVAVRAMLDGRCVGAGAMELSDGVLALAGVSVIPAMRRKGIQLALLAWRLQEGARRGAQFATIGSLPGASTESNAARMGFAVAYSKAVVIRPGEGLAPVEVG